jgi:hypothetical protein
MPLLRQRLLQATQSTMARATPAITVCLEVISPCHALMSSEVLSAALQPGCTGVGQRCLIASALIDVCHAVHYCKQQPPFRLCCCSYVLQQIRALATQEFDTAVLPRAQQLVCAGPLTFLQLLLSHNSQLQAQLQVSNLEGATQCWTCCSWCSMLDELSCACCWGVVCR